MKRINGFLDIDAYYNSIMEAEGLTRTGLAYQGYIHSSKYKDDHFWLKINDEYYYFKYTDSLYEELIVSEIAKFLGIDAVTYDLAIFNGKEGVISRSYRKTDARYVSGTSVLCEYLRNDDNVNEIAKMGHKVKNNTNYYKMVQEAEKVNNLEIIWQAIEQRYKGQNIDMETIMNKLISIMMLNILTAQGDGMPQNWELEETENNVSVMPFIDAELCFQNTLFYPRPTSALSTNFKDAGKSNYDILKEFLTISSSEYFNLFLEKFEQLTLENFLDIIAGVERKIGRVMPLLTKKRIIKSFENNRNLINEVLNDLENRQSRS